MGWSGHFTGVLIVAIVVLGPIWLSMHYRARNSASRGGSEMARKIDDLTDVAGRLQARVEVLERLLDAGQSNKGKQEP
ncbi:MAG TPA: hypothetical protein VN809_07020 [Telmatospirillum sp.]|nr:hypothetical protein [Telmatospirillum sp.]